MKNKEQYYEAVQKLREWEKRRDREGTNYVTDQYIQKYQTIIDNLSGVPKNPKLKIEPQTKLTKREWNDQIKKKVKNLNNKIRRGQASWVDIFLFDVWTKKNKNEWRLPI